MLCASSPGLGKQFHQWIPSISSKVSLLHEDANVADIKKYYTKIYPRADSESVSEISKEFVKEQKKKRYLSQVYPNLKITDIEILSQLVTDEEINQYEADRGN